MAGPRRYQLLCPIARALDRVGDRWTLLILRDLHAGPARFSDLLTGLDGIASNLLTSRLHQLTADGLIRKRDAEFGVVLYALTDLGARTAGLLFELALFGGRFPPDDHLKRPGNLRTVAVTLKAAAQRVVTQDASLRAALNIDGEHFTLIARDGQVDVRYQLAENPDVTLTTAYEPMVAVADGRMPINSYISDHATIEANSPGKDGELMALLGAAIAAIRDESGR